MRRVTVEKQEFIERVSANRESHRATFEAAVEGFRERMVAELDRRIRDLRRGRRIDQYIGLPEPEDHTDDYDRVLTMAEMSVETTVELDESEFAMYVIDQWHWKQAFADSTSPYLANGRR